MFKSIYEFLFALNLVLLYFTRCLVSENWSWSR